MLNLRFLKERNQSRQAAYSAKNAWYCVTSLGCKVILLRWRHKTL